MQLSLFFSNKVWLVLIHSPNDFYDEHIAPMLMTFEARVHENRHPVMSNTHISMRITQNLCMCMSSLDSLWTHYLSPLIDKFLEFGGKNGRWGLPNCGQGSYSHSLNGFITNVTVAANLQAAVTPFHLLQGKAVSRVVGDTDGTWRCD